ncbi:hypothetical protein [Streptomyces daliensis]
MASGSHTGTTRAAVSYREGLARVMSLPAVEALLDRVGLGLDAGSDTAR